MKDGGVFRFVKGEQGKVSAVEAVRTNTVGFKLFCHQSDYKATEYTLLCLYILYYIFSHQNFISNEKELNIFSTSSVLNTFSVITQSIHLRAVVSYFQNDEASVLIQKQPDSG